MTLARRLATIGAFVLLAACGRGGEDMPNERGIWAFGVPEIEGEAKAGVAPTTSAPPPAESLPPPMPTPTPSAPPVPTPSSPVARAGSYEVVDVPDGGTIRGICRVTFAGAPVQNKPIEPFKHQESCGRSHPSERLVYGPGRELGGCFVSIVDVTKGKDWPEEMRKGQDDRTHFIDQKTCMYVPHVGWFRPGTQLVIGNADGVDHNIHGYFGAGMVDTRFNFPSKPRTTAADVGEAFLEAPGIYFLKCDIHPWMSAYQHAASNPYCDVTSAVDDPARGRKAGEYVLDGVPPGTYTVECWHEGMREEPEVVDGKIATYTYSPPVRRNQKVVVKAGEPAQLDFEIPYP